MFCSGFVRGSLSTSACTQWFRIDGKIGELYDIEVLSNVAHLSFNKIDPDDASVGFIRQQIKLAVRSLFDVAQAHGRVHKKAFG